MFMSFVVYLVYWFTLVSKFVDLFSNDIPRCGKLINGELIRKGK